MLKHSIFNNLISLFQRFPHTTLMHQKLFDIISTGLKSGNKEVLEAILYKADLVKLILSLTE